MNENTSATIYVADAFCLPINLKSRIKSYIILKIFSKISTTTTIGFKYIWHIDMLY